MLEFVQYTDPNAEALSEQINKVKGDRSMAMFADEIRRSSPSVKVSAPTISRACNWSGGNPVSIELLEAIALIADEGTGVTRETLLVANGMRSKSEVSQRDTAVRDRELVMKTHRTVSMIIQSEITYRGYVVRMLEDKYNGYFFRGYEDQTDRIFLRNYNFGFAVSGMYPCSTWKFGLCSSTLRKNSNEKTTEAYVGNFINRVAPVFASDSIEGELYETEKYSFVFIDRKIYEAFIKRVKSHGMLVNGLMTAILVSLNDCSVLEEIQLDRYDGAKASSFFKGEILQQDESMELFEQIDFEDEGDL